MKPDARLNRPFDCPICQSNEYSFVGFPRKDGSIYLTDYFRCGGCSVTFTDPERFSRALRCTYLPEQKWREARPTRETVAYPQPFNAADWMKKG